MRHWDSILRNVNFQVDAEHAEWENGITGNILRYLQTGTQSCSQYLLPIHSNVNYYEDGLVAMKILSFVCIERCFWAQHSASKVSVLETTSIGTANASKNSEHRLSTTCRRLQAIWLLQKLQSLCLIL